jgi:hypothetical protein
MFSFQLLQLIHEPVEFGVSDFRIVEDVIAVFVMADFLAQGLDLGFDVLRGGRHFPKIIKSRHDPRVDSRAAVPTRNRI